MNNRGFLKEIIYRIDYRFLDQETFESLYSFLCNTFGKRLNNCKCELANFNQQIDIDDFTNKVMVLSDDENREIIKLGREFIIVNLKLKQQKEDDVQYNDWISCIVDYIKTKCESRVFIKRVGIRKNNKFYIENRNLKNLSRIFVTPFFYQDSHNSLSLETIETIESRQVYKKNNAYLCLLKKMDTGFLNDKKLGISNEKAHNICFDFDYFYPNIECINDFMNNPADFLNQVQKTILDCFEQMVSLEARNDIDDRQKMYDDFGVILID